MRLAGDKHTVRLRLLSGTGLGTLHHVYSAASNTTLVILSCMNPESSRLQQTVECLSAKAQSVGPAGAHLFGQELGEHCVSGRDLVGVAGVGWLGEVKIRVDDTIYHNSVDALKDSVSESMDEETMLLLTSGNMRYR